ncbi:hypothetical protein ACBT36_004611 [Escherichia coli O19:H7]|nr:hypothetical protein [Escherichia coli]QOD32884.1 hypothetical protein ID627_12815 [Escherichia coli O19:H7]EHS7485413.1 hypothetical protein [Escherichia coli]EKS8749817.1 hypothetical protein [Escherichia coli]ELL8701348.1 hypothetical protein [Escherichia coli]
MNINTNKNIRQVC